MTNRIARERGCHAADPRAPFEHEPGPTAPSSVGSPETVAQKIAHAATRSRDRRFDLKYDVIPGAPRRGPPARTIELLRSVVAPRVRELLAG